MTQEANILFGEVFTFAILRTRAVGYCSVGTLTLSLRRALRRRLACSSPKAAAGPCSFNSGGPGVFSFCAFDVTWKTSLSKTGWLRFSPVFPVKTPTVLYFTPRLFIHVEFLFTFCFGIIRFFKHIWFIFYKFWIHWKHIKTLKSHTLNIFKLEN